MGYVLGINSAYHESAACLLRDGVPVAFAEEERFNRRKHGKIARVDNPDELQVEAVGYSFNPPPRRRNARLDEPVRPGDWGSEAGEDLFQRRLQHVPAALD